MLSNYESMRLHRSDQSGQVDIGVGEQVLLGLVGHIRNIYLEHLSRQSGPYERDRDNVDRPEREATATVTVTFAGGSCEKAFSVLEPASESAVIYSLIPMPRNARSRYVSVAHYRRSDFCSFHNVECLRFPDRPH